MAYTPFHADWKDYPDETTPITAAALEHIETGISAAAATADAAIAKAIVDAKGDLIVATAADTVARKAVGSNDTVLTAASGQSDGTIWQKIVNGMVDAAAAIAYSKLNLAGSIVNADIATNAAIVRTKLATTTRKATPLASFTSAVTNNAWPDAATNTVELFIEVPDDYLSGDIVFKVHHRASASGNTMVMRKSSFRIRSGSAITVIDSSVNINISPADTNSNVITATIAASNFQAGDIIRLQIQRLGADGGDTSTASLQFDGAWVEYTGYV